jgi:hypothetical protein
MAQHEGDATYKVLYILQQNSRTKLTVTCSYQLRLFPQNIVRPKNFKKNELLEEKSENISHVIIIAVVKYIIICDKMGMNCLKIMMH